jgi:hypothetical protein
MEIVCRVAVITDRAVSPCEIRKFGKIKRALWWKSFLAMINAAWLFAANQAFVDLGLPSYLFQCKMKSAIVNCTRCRSQFLSTAMLEPIGALTGLRGNTPHRHPCRISVMQLDYFNRPFSKRCSEGTEPDPDVIPLKAERHHARLNSHAPTHSLGPMFSRLATRTPASFDNGRIRSL